MIIKDIKIDIWKNKDGVIAQYRATEATGTSDEGDTNIADDSKNGKERE